MTCVIASYAILSLPPSMPPSLSISRCLATSLRHLVQGRKRSVHLEQRRLILGVDRLLDMIRTAINVSGDAAVSTVVAVKENKLNREVFANAN